MFNVCVIDAVCCTVSARVRPHALGCNERARAFPCFMCVGRLIVCCGESAEGRSKARSHSPRGERMLRNPFAETEKQQQRAGKCTNTIGERRGGKKRGKITLDVRKSRE